MMRTLRSFIGGMLVAVLLISGVGVVRGSVFAQSSQIILCAKKTSGAVRYARKSCLKTETKLVVNLKGIDGAVGPQGQQGVPGQSGSQGVPGQDRAMIDNMNIVPSGFGQMTRIWREARGCCDLPNASLFIHTTIKEYDPQDLDWTAITPDETFQLWVEYFDEDGNYLQAQTPSVNVYDSPAGDTTTTNSVFSYELKVNGIHNNLPVGAEYFRLIMRPADANVGTLSHQMFAFVSTSITAAG